MSSETPTYKLFVSCIPGTAQESEILTCLLNYADVISVTLERRKNNKCSGYGYALAKTEEDY